MDITFSCPNCRQQLDVDESGAGLSVPCPKCGQNLTIPVESPALKKPSVIQKWPSAPSESSSKAESSPQASQQASSRDLFHIYLDEKVQGPYTLQQLERLYYSGVVPSDTAYMKNSSDEWHPISELFPMLKDAEAMPSLAPIASTSAEMALTTPATAAQTLEEETAAEIERRNWYRDIEDDLRKLVALRQIQDALRSRQASKPAMDAILAKYQYTDYRYTTLDGISVDIANLGVSLGKKEFNPQDYRTTAELTAVYEAIKSEMGQIQSKRSQ
jgi:uncharacterized protein YbaR (Trm112 family)